MKNSLIQFNRIFFTYLIAFYHLNNVYGHYTSWYIAVEFFFIVSGALIARKYYYLKEKNDLDGFAWKDLKKTYLKYFPHALFAFAVALLGKGYYLGYGIYDYLNGIISHLPEIFLFHSIGLNWPAGFAYNSVSWYLSTLIIDGFVIRTLLKKYDRSYIKIICPLSIILIYPYLCLTYGYIGEHWDCRYIILNSALLRGFADLNLGVIAYEVAKKLSHYDDRILLSVSAVSLILGGVVIPFFFYQTVYDFILVFIISIGVTSAFACLSSNKLFEHPLIEKWALITPSVYLNHKVFRDLFCLIWPRYTVLTGLIWFVFITLYSILTYYGVTMIITWLGDHLHKFFRQEYPNE